MSSDDVVIINDENQKDSDIEVVEISKETRKGLSSTQENSAIIIDDDIIEIIDVDATRSNKDIKDYLRKVCSDNRLIGEFVEKCLDLENSNGMLRVIYRTFLPLYFKMEDGYRESADFKKVIDMTMRALEVHPNLKFTHLKFVCEWMKSKSRDRKKAQFTTLSSNVTAKPTKPRKQKRRRKRHGKRSSAKRAKKRKTENVIELDESSDGEDKRDEPLDPTTNDVVILENGNERSNTSNKENRIVVKNSASSVQDSNIDVGRAENQHIGRTVSEASPQIQPGTRLDEREVECKNRERIKQIEKQIEYYKKLIDALEQEEVKTDSLDSPYIQCERMKTHIVALYKELCSLTGDEPVKKREIHFTATDGRPQLPLKILEKFINENIGLDGIPCLPDFFDVQECVSQANKYAGLGWDKARIWHEARALFTFCGQALQDSRKKREWRYMIGLANSQLDDDPAERDPQLMARLEANRRIGVKKELDLLEQYVKMEEGRADGESIPNDVHVSQDSSDDELERNTFAASTSNQINRDKVKSSTVTNDVNSCRIEDGPLNNGINMGYIIDNTIYRSYEQRFVNNQVHNKGLKQSHNSLKNKTDNRMLEISVGGNQNPEVRVVTVNSTHDIGNQKIVASSQESNDSTRMIEVCVENNKPPEVKVINVTSSEHNNKGNVDRDSVTDTSTCLTEFDNSINENFLETFEDTYKDFVKNRSESNFGKDKINNNSIVTSKRKNILRGIPLQIKDVYSAGSNQNGPCNSMNNYSENMPLVIKEVYSVATQQIDNTKNCSGHNHSNKYNYVELGNKPQSFSEISVSTKQMHHSKRSKNSDNNRSRNDSSVASENMPILIKEVYSVATKQINTSIQDNRSGLDNSDVTEKVKPQDIPQEICSGEADKNKENNTVRSHNDDDTAHTNPEGTKSNVEEGNSVKVKTEISDLLKEMDNFGDSFTATVFDIEDPFLVIEISDSSDESGDDLER